MIDRLPPAIRRSRAVRARVDPHRPRRGHRGRRVPQARGLLPPGPREGLRGHPRPVRAPRADRHRHRRRGAWSGPRTSRRSAVAPTSARCRTPTPTAVHATQYARIVERKALLRNLIGAAGQDRRHRLRGSGRGPGGDRPRGGRAVRGQPASGRGRVLAARGLLHDAYDRLDYLHAHRGEISGIRTGFGDLDTLTTGLQKSDLVILAARPSIGKTSFALNIAEHAAVRDKKSVGIFSLEMSKEQLVLRLLSSVANIDSQRLRVGLPRGARLRAHRPGDERPVRGADLHRRHAQHHDDGAADEGAPAPGGVRASTW